jgi:multiple sugar transport system substrate-binding protein
VTQVPSGKNLKLWWWGEQEAPGLEKWVNDSVAINQKNSGNTIEPTLQDTAVVISEFQTASAAKNAPDMQFLWNGIYHMESVWLGYLEPLDALIPADELAASQPTILSVFDGKTYRMGWYSAGPMWLYNKEMFDKAGLNADTPPKTWDELMDAGDKLKTAGFLPISVGLKDGYWGEWYMGHGLGQNLDTPADAINLFIGELDWREPKYYEHWGKELELWQAGFINDDTLSVELYPGIDMFGAGQAAMTAIVTPIAASQATALGSSEKIGPMVFPVFGTGKMAGKAIADDQGFGISVSQVEVAADFLRSCTPGAIQACGRILKSHQWIRVRWQCHRGSCSGPSGKAGLPDTVTISDLMPVLFWTDAMFVNSQKIISGEYTPEQAGQNAYDVTQKWVEQNPDMVENYAAWAKDLAAA